MLMTDLGGDPIQDRLGYVLPITRKDHRTGKSLVRGFMLCSPMRGLIERLTTPPVMQGAAGGGESILPTIRQVDEYTLSTTEGN